MDARHSNILLGAMIGFAAACACFVAGWLLLVPRQSSPSPGQFAIAADAPAVPAATPEPDVRPATHKYKITIETSADWSRVILSNGATFTADPGVSVIELNSETPEKVGHFLYSPTEIAINQIQACNARILVKGVVESSRPVLEVRTGHGDNGPITISSPVDAFTNDKNLGDGTNFVTGTVRLE